MSALTAEEMQIARMINENNERITSHINQILKENFAKQDAVMTERLKMGIDALGATQEADPVEQRKYWIRVFASQIVSRDTVQHSVKYAHELWDALETSFNDGKVVH